MTARLGDDYPELAHLLGAYLNQDFDIYGPTLGAAVRAFVADDGPRASADVRHDIARLLREHPDDTEAALLAVEPYFARPPGMDACAYLTWLDGVLGRPSHTQDHAAE